MGRVFLLIGFGICAAIAASAASTSSEERLRDIRVITGLIGLSPAGAEIWAKAALANSDGRKYDRSNQLHLAIGRELSLDTPDQRRLSKLVDQAAADAERLERMKKAELLDTAFRLSLSDRKILGQFMVRSAKGDDKPVTVVLP